MAGSGKKAYTMQEMREVVSYLVQRGAYSEIRARSMWVKFANSGRTTRTWQSLKETFLKRILPDIHNPYYNLTRDQITSFRAGTDISKMSANRLKFRQTGETSRSNIEIRPRVEAREAEMFQVIESRHADALKTTRPQDVESEERYGPHIVSLYPRACTVPELSTITEDSSDTRGSKAKVLLTPQASMEKLQTCSSSTH